MIKAFGVSAAAALLLAATGASAAAPQEAEAKPEKKICKSQKMTGSLTRVTRICKTRTEWNELADANSRALDRMGRSANQAEAMTNRTASATGAGSAGGF